MKEGEIRALIQVAMRATATKLMPRDIMGIELRRDDLRVRCRWKWGGRD